METKIEITRKEANERAGELTQELQGNMKDLGIEQIGAKKVSQAISRALLGEPIEFVVGSCPDYSHDGSVYTYEGIGSGVPLLSLVHVSSARRYLSLFLEHQVPFKFNILIADVEADDEYFCNRYAGGDKDSFIAMCHASMTQTQIYMNETFSDNPEIVNSSSFTEALGAEIMELQYAYQDYLTNLMKSDSSFQMRVQADTSARINMYRGMYGPILQEMSSQEVDAYYKSRTIRTMAQYLAYGRRISEVFTNPIVVNHPTRNITMLNQTNKYLLEGDNVDKPKLPVIQLSTRVY